MNSAKKAVNFCINFIRRICRKWLPALGGRARAGLYVVTALDVYLTLIQTTQNLLPEAAGYIVYVAAVFLLLFGIPYVYMDLSRGMHFVIESNALTKKFFHDTGFRVVFTTVLSMGINLTYMIYNAVWGIRNHSPWFISLAVYYSFLGGIRAFSLYQKRKTELLRDKAESGKREYLVMKQDGILLMLITADLSIMILLILTKDTVEISSSIHVITVAFYTFYKIGAAVFNMIKVKKLDSLILTAIRNIGLADALVSMLSLQAVMLVSMETSGNRHFIDVMNGSTGLAVCGAILLMGGWMIWRALKETKKGGQDERR